MKLREYQREVAHAVLDSVRTNAGHTFSVEMSRQGGKNELSAHLEILLMLVHMARGGSIIKCSPTFKPQTIISMQRLRDRLIDFGLADLARSEMGYMVSLGFARAIFLSAEHSTSVVGHTADILMEIDESQDVSKDKYTKEFRPMGSPTNVTTIHYGTAWDDSTLLEEVKQTNLELEKKDGVKRHFRFDWQVVAKHNQQYRRYVSGELTRLGIDHPLFRTQYMLEPLRGGGRFVTAQQIETMTGQHGRLPHPDPGAYYVAGIDLAGEREETKEEALASARHKIDSTVITIAQVELAKRAPTQLIEPNMKIVAQYQWTGEPHSQLYPIMVDLLRRWDAKPVVVDSTGIGQPVASFLKKELGARVVPFVFTQRSKSDLGFNLLAFVNSGRIKLYKQDGYPEFRNMMEQLTAARSMYRPNQTMNFYVDPADGHDDFLVSLALAAHGAADFSPMAAKGGQRND